MHTTALITNICIFVFWLCFAGIFYTYFFYPLLLGLLSFFIKKPVKKSPIEPSVSLIIAVHNEEKDIARKIEETLQLDYPGEKLQIIVASDYSDDKTDEIAAGYKDEGVLLVRQSQRHGKTAVQNKAVEQAKGEILIFSDATTRYSKDVVRKLVRNFADSRVGCVGAELLYVNGAHSQLGIARNIYWSYEKYLRRKESNLNTLLGVSGCCYAVRKSVYQAVDPRLISDFIITWFIFEQGYRTVFESDAKVYEDVTETETDEIQMRERLTNRSLVAFSIMKRFFNPLRYGFFSFQVFSHKILRYCVPIFVIAIFLTTVLLIRIPLYRNMFYLQAILILLAALSIALKEKFFFYPFFYFIMGNYSIMRGFLRLRKTSKSYDIWQPLRK